MDTIAWAGLLNTENSVLYFVFDYSGLQLIYSKANKTIKFWKLYNEVTPQSHPLNWISSLVASRKY